MVMNVENWFADPIRRANTSTLAITGVLMLLVADSEPVDLAPLEFMRGSASLLMALHAAMHVGMLNALRLMALLDAAKTQHALESYRDPRRVSHLDLAAVWLGFYALAPLLADL
jgi:hypothetical protein